MNYLENAERHMLIQVKKISLPTFQAKALYYLRRRDEAVIRQVTIRNEEGAQKLILNRLTSPIRLARANSSEPRMMGLYA
jgi:hypothetical protein